MTPISGMRHTVADQLILNTLTEFLSSHSILSSAAIADYIWSESADNVLVKLCKNYLHIFDKKTFNSDWKINGIKKYL